MERQEATSPGLRGSSPLASVLVILGIAAALHLPWIRAPFGPNEVNSTSYFGPFAQSFARFGFGALRGIPIAGYGLGNLAEGVPYLNHPPAVAWLSSFGTSEWQIRLPFVIAQGLAGCALYGLLRRRLEPWRATLAGCILVCLPVFAFYGRTIFNAFTVLCGLLLFLFFDLAAASTGRRRAFLATLLGVTAVVGIWMDWPFVFWIGGLVAFVPGRSFRRDAWLLVTASLSTALGAASILLWQNWATSNPELPFALPAPQGSILLTILRDRPPPSDLVRNLGSRFVEGFSLPVLAIAGLGLLPLALRAPRLVTAFVLTAVAHVGIFASHARTHPTFSSDFGPLIAAAACAFPTLPGRFGRAVAVVIALVALGSATGASTARMREADTPFLRDVGGTLDELSADVRPDGSIARFYRVRHNLPFDFPYYIRSPFTRPHAFTHSEVERDLAGAGQDGFRYVRFEVATSSERIAGAFRIEPQLSSWLAQFPSRPLPALLQHLEVPGSATTARIVDCRVYEIKN